MNHKRLAVLAGAALMAVQGLVPSNAHAVGFGIPFLFRETPIPGTQMHVLAATAQDFTYQDCADFTAPGVFTERGYFWVSSFQDPGGVVDSQINDFMPNGYHIYARYVYTGEECSSDDMCDVNRTRLNYTLESGSIQLFVDPLSDTVLGLANCAVVVAGNADDLLVGGAPAIVYGEKTETNARINGDFEIEFTGWNFTNFGHALYRDPAGNPLLANRLIVNGNVTQLLGPLGNDHFPEGSGNFFFRFVD